MLLAVGKARLFAKPPDGAEHTAAARDTHDPFIYMATFFEHFGRKSCIFNALK
jgi:hypothetical protein